MKKQHEQLLVATLAGLIILSAAAFVAQPALAKVQPPQMTGASVLRTT